MVYPFHFIVKKKEKNKLFTLYCVCARSSPCTQKGACQPRNTKSIACAGWRFLRGKKGITLIHVMQIIDLYICCEVSQRTLSPPSALSGRPLLRGSAPKTPPPAPSISYTESPSPCGGGTPAFGCTASQPSPPQWTV